MLDQGPDVPRGVQEALGKAQATHSFCQQLPAGPPPPLEADLCGGVSSSDVFGVSSGLAEEVVAGDQRQGRQEARGFSWAPHPLGHQMAHVLLLKDISLDGGLPQMPPSGSYNQSLLSPLLPGAPHHPYSSSHTLPMPPLTVPVENSHQ